MVKGLEKYFFIDFHKPLNFQLIVTLDPKLKTLKNTSFGKNFAFVGQVVILKSFSFQIIFFPQKKSKLYSILVIRHKKVLSRLFSQNFYKWWSFFH